MIDEPFTNRTMSYDIGLFAESGEFMNVAFV